MKAVRIGSSNLRECSRCEGVWADPETLQQICTQGEKQAAVLSMPVPACLPAGLQMNFRYLPCPVCHKLMNRVNFAQGSHLVLDVCKAHGTWFGRHALRQTVEFIRAGGLEKARARQIAQLEEERRKLVEASRNVGGTFEVAHSFHWQEDERGLFEDFLRMLLP